MTSRHCHRTDQFESPLGAFIWEAPGGDQSAVPGGYSPEWARTTLVFMRSKQARAHTQRRLNDVQIGRGICIATDTGSEALDLQADRGDSRSASVSSLRPLGERGSSGQGSTTCWSTFSVVMDHPTRLH